LAVFDDGSGPALYVGGGFRLAGEVLSDDFAIWRCAPNYLPGDANCDGAVDTFDIDPFVLALVNPTAYRGSAWWPVADTRVIEARRGREGSDPSPKR